MREKTSECMEMDPHSLKYMPRPKPDHTGARIYVHTLKDEREITLEYMEGVMPPCASKCMSRLKLDCTVA